MRAKSYINIAGLVLGASLVLSGCSKQEEQATVESAAAASASSTTTATAEEVARANAAKASAKPASTINTNAMTEETKKRLEQTVASSFGKGSFENDDGATYSFTIEGSMLKDKSSHGSFRFYSFEGDKKLDVEGSMNCVHIDSKNRRIWMTGEVTQNNSTADKYMKGAYATGGHLVFRARPNSLDGNTPGGIEQPTFVSAADAKAFCNDKAWSDGAIHDLGPGDLIAAIP